METKDVRVGTQEGPQVRLAKLCLNIVRGNELVRTVEVDDPREKLIEHFNRDALEHGLSAELP